MPPNVSMPPAEAEQHVADALRGWGYEVERLAERQGKKTADFRASNAAERWVLDVKARQSDRKIDEQMQTADMVEVYRRPHDVEEHSAEVRFRKGAEQVAATREAGELGAVWVVASRALGMQIDPARLVCHLLGHRRIFFNRKPWPVLRVYEPQFADVDLLVIEHDQQVIDVLLNPWTRDDRIAATRASEIVRRARRVFDPRADLDDGRAWVAPDDAEAYRLAVQHLAQMNTSKKADSHADPRARREFQVECALREIHGDDVGGFIRETHAQIAVFVPDAER